MFRGGSGCVVIQCSWVIHRTLLVGGVLLAALSGAPTSRAATGDTAAPTGPWAVMMNVGTIYSVVGQRMIDNLKSNYIQLAGGDPDDTDVPQEILKDSFLEVEPDEPAPPQPQEEPEKPDAPAIVQDKAAPAGDADVGSQEQRKPELAGSEMSGEMPGEMPGVMLISSPVRLPVLDTADVVPGAGTLSLDDALPAPDAQATIGSGANNSPDLTLDDVPASKTVGADATANSGSLALDDQKGGAEPADAELDLANDELVAEAGDKKPDPEASCFELATVTLVGSTLMDQPMVDVMFGGEIGSCITPGLIGSALERLNGYFLDAGFVTTRAYITPQDLKTGTLEITVVEGTIEDIRLNDNTAEDRRRIRMAFAAKPGDILNINDIDQGLAQINRPQSVVATLNLVPGSEAGQTIVQIDEKLVRKPVRYKLGVDNSGSKSTGTTKSTLGVDADNLLSMNETISVSHIGSADTNALAGSITLPVGRNTIEASGSYSDYLSDVDQYTQIFGRTDTRELKLTRALFKTKAGDVKAEMSLTKKSTRRTINDLVLAPQRLTTARAGLKYSGKLENGTSLSANLYLAAGTKLLNATRDVNLHKTAPRAQFQKVQMDGSLTFPQFPGMTIQTSYAGQLAPHPLYSSEQISVGGQKSVRGSRAIPFPETAGSTPRPTS